MKQTVAFEVEHSIRITSRYSDSVGKSVSEGCRRIERSASAPCPISRRLVMPKPAGFADGMAEVLGRQVIMQE